MHSAAYIGSGLVMLQNNHHLLHMGNYYCIADLLIQWFRSDQTSQSDGNLTQDKQNS